MGVMKIVPQSRTQKNWGLRNPWTENHETVTQYTGTQ